MKQSILCLSAADIHGNMLQYEKIKQLVASKKIAYVFLCGDLLPKTGGSWHPENKVRTIQMQADFITDFFIDYLTELGTLTQVYAIFGNDDFKSNYHLLSGNTIPGVHFLDNEVVKMPNLEVYVAGYPYVGVTPFLHKDWEKWDVKPGVLPHKIFRTDGYTSQDGKHIAVDLASNDSTIQDDLQRLARCSDPTKTVYVFHEAPFNTPLDMIAPDNKYIKNDELHIGSQAIREFVETKQPLVTMHGHIHETVEESGNFLWQSGESVGITAANDFSSDTLSYVLFPLDHPSEAKRFYC